MPVCPSIHDIDMLRLIFHILYYIFSIINFRVMPNNCSHIKIMSLVFCFIIRELFIKKDVTKFVLEYDVH